VVQGQIIAVLEDIGADVIKTGMLASVPIIEAVAAALKGHNIPRVVDPVMRAKGGHALLPDAAATALIEKLVKGAALITPNLPEAEALTGRVIKTEADMTAAIPALRGLGATAVLLKGGHLEGPRVVDMLITAKDVVRFEDTRIDSAATHGTGCTLASAIAAGLADKMPLPDAIARARAYVRKAMLTAPGLGKGHGPLNHGHTVAAFSPGK
ncbi:MAG: hydroxymethylpyrimidine/phosphomethylpyrimidine kinase, partial [Rhodospirillaceae bacterium]|nr:hydroxymethylpyrimidine/phosphomethylpyrimidine kinase [Rhodospirillaceae bacterium]